MRHLKAGRALGVNPSHRRAMMRNLVTSILEHGQVKTTLARAKEARKPLDKMISLGKRGDLASRRQALTFVKSKEAMANCFGDLAERYKDRNGGYSRILRLGPRRGDGAEMVLMMLVGSENDPFDAKKSRGKGKGRKKDKAVLDEVASEVTAKDKATKAEASAEAPAEEASEEITEAEVTEAPAEDAEAKEEEK